MRISKLLSGLVCLVLPALVGLTGLAQASDLSIPARSGGATGASSLFSPAASDAQASEWPITMRQSGNPFYGSGISLNRTSLLTTYVYLPVVVTVDADPFVVRAVNRTNFYRSQHGCPPLHMHSLLNSAALRHSTDMALHDFFGHIGSDGSTTSDRVREAGYSQYSQLGENIGAGYTTPEAVVDAWMSSGSGHRENILNCAYKDIGIGYYYLADDTGSENYHHYWSQILATPW